MKKIYLFLIVLFILVPITRVNAASGVLEPGSFSMECVYDNGVSIEASYDNNAYGLTSSSFKLSNKVDPPYVSTYNVFYEESEFSQSILDSATCPEYIYWTVIKQTKDDASVTVPVYIAPGNMYRFDWNDPGYDRDFMMSKLIAGFEPQNASAVVFTISQNSPLNDKNSLYITGSDANGKTIDIVIFHFNLVSETINLNGNTEPIRNWAFKSGGEQAASKNMYVRLYEYQTKNGSTIQIAEKDRTYTKVKASNKLETSNPNDTQFICFKAASKSIETGKNDMAYTFSAIKHDYTFKKTADTKAYMENPRSILTGMTCPSGYSLFSEVSWDEGEEEGEDKTSICEVIPETALVLTRIIKWMQILVPGLLIGLTAFDIGKIVVSGNLEEELPKQKKKIIIRIIVAIIFFFLPIIVQIITSWSYDVDYGDVSCLWYGGE